MNFPNKQATLWLIDDQSVYCLDGKPLSINIDSQDSLLTDDGVIALGKDYPHTYVCQQTSAKRWGILPDDSTLIPYRQLVGTLGGALAVLLARCLGLMYWHNTHRFCGACGAATIHDHANVLKTCPNCQLISYPKVQPCIITAILRIDDTRQKTQILLAKHHRHANIYSLIAGFVEVGESLENCLHREVYEEVGLTVNALEFFGSQAWPYPSNLMVGFICHYQSGEICIQQEELADAQFFDLDNLPNLPPKGSIARRMIEHVLSRHKNA